MEGKISETMVLKERWSLDSFAGKYGGKGYRNWYLRRVGPWVHLQGNLEGKFQKLVF